MGVRVSDAGALEQPVYADGAYKPFGEFTLADVTARADELQAATAGARRPGWAAWRGRGRSWRGR